MIATAASSRDASPDASNSASSMPAICSGGSLSRIALTYAGKSPPGVRSAMRPCDTMRSKIMPSLREPGSYSPTTISIGRSSTRARIAMRVSGRSPIRSAWLAGTTSESLRPSPVRHFSFGMMPGIEAENR